MKTQVSWVWSLPWDSFCLSWLPLPIKWWQYLKPSSKAVLQKKHWHKSSGKGFASASWVLFCAFTHCLLSGAAYCHIWGKELWLRTGRETYAVPVNAPALLPSVRLEGTWSHPAVPRLLWKKINVSRCAQVTLEGGNGVQLCPAHPTPRCHQGCTHLLQRSTQGIRVLSFPISLLKLSHFRFAKKTTAATWVFCFMIFASLLIS